MTEKKNLTPELSSIIFLIGFAFYQITGLVLATVMDVNGNAYIFVAYAMPQAAYIAVTFITVKVCKAEFKLLPEKGSVDKLDYPLAVLLGLGIFFFALLPNYGVQKLIALLGKTPQVTVPDLTSPVSCVVAAIVICVLPAIGEELVFRKVFVDGFSKYGKINAVIISGVLFGLSHLNLAQTIHQIFLGCILSFLYVKTKNITLTAIIHFINNFLALFLTRFTGEEIWKNLVTLGICCAIGAVFIALNIIYLIKRKPKITNEGKEKPSLFSIGFFVFVAAMWIIAVVLS